MRLGGTGGRAAGYPGHLGHRDRCDRDDQDGRAHRSHRYRRGAGGDHCHIGCARQAARGARIKSGAQAPTDGLMT